MKASRRVVVTGIGLVTPFGLGTETFWSALTAGKGAVGRVDLLNGSGDGEQLAARVPEFRARDHVSNRRLLRIMCRTDHFGLVAAQMAIEEAGEAEPEPGRKGAFIGTSKEMGPIEPLFDAARPSRDETGEMTSRGLGSDGFGEIPPLTLVEGLPNGCLFASSVIHSIKGANTNFLGSGEAGLVAIGGAYRAVQRGDADWALAGGHDSGVDRWSYANFHRLQMLSQRRDDPERAVRPFDRTRDGFAVSEGACMVVLEELERARTRGANIYAEILGYGATCDAAGQVSPREDGEALAAAITGSLREADLGPGGVDYVNAYASATPVGDRTELRALELVFGGASRRPLVSGIKGALGHMLAASGAVEFAATALALHHQTVPPTLNLTEPDADCHFDCVPATARSADAAAALTVSRGIGGQNASMALSRAGN
jgi:3-oxoacyl-[acyl-carrier-protein] synthase II